MSSVRYVDDVQSYLSNLTETALLIYSPSSLSLLESSNWRMKQINYHQFAGDAKKIEVAARSLRGYREVVSLGGGSPTDTAKYLAYLIDAEFICIPSMLSTNAYSTNKVALRQGQKKVTLGAKLPDLVLLDHKLIEKSGYLKFAGLADVLSIHTALHDWRLAADKGTEAMDEAIYDQAELLLEKTVDCILGKDSFSSPADIKEAFDLIGMAGELTNIYGSGRPESGSEHIFAKSLEMQIDVPHGVSVSLGIIMMALAQGQLKQDIADCIKRLGLFDRLGRFGIDRPLLRKTLITLEPREDRYSIVNAVDFGPLYVESLLDEFDSATGLLMTEPVNKLPDSQAVPVGYSG